MSSRKPKLPLLYVEDQSALWLQTATATIDRDAAAMCRRQWQSSTGTSAAPAPIAMRGRMH